MRVHEDMIKMIEEARKELQECDDLKRSTFLIAFIKYWEKELGLK